MKNKYFVVSDLHGHYDELMEALENNDFDWDNESHILIVAGDWTDRGTQCAELYKLFITNPGKIIVTQGNHDEFLIEYRRTLNITSIDKHNGVVQTLVSLVSAGLSIAEVTDFLKGLPPFFETKTHIITHASIAPTGDWRNPQWTKETVKQDPWMRDLHWNNGSFYRTKVYNTDKTIVVGHFSTNHLRHIYKLLTEEETDDSILYSEDKQKVFIDACTVLTKKVNVYIFEDEEYTHEETPRYGEGMSEETFQERLDTKSFSGAELEDLATEEYSCFKMFDYLDEMETIGSSDLYDYFRETKTIFKFRGELYAIEWEEGLGKHGENRCIWQPYKVRKEQRQVVEDIYLPVDFDLAESLTRPK